MKEEKKNIWEHEGDWYIQPDEGLKWNCSTKEAAEILLDLLNGKNKPAIPNEAGKEFIENISPPIGVKMKTAEWIEDYKLKAESALELFEDPIIKNLSKMVLSLIKDRKEIVDKINGWIKYYQATEDRMDKEGDKISAVYYNGCRKALTELLKELEK